MYICGRYSQLNTANNSIKTHLLKHTHNRRREKRYVHVVTTHSLTHKMKTHQLKDKKRDRDVVVCMQFFIKSLLFFCNNYRCNQAHINATRESNNSDVYRHLYLCLYHLVWAYQRESVTVNLIQCPQAL